MKKENIKGYLENQAPEMTAENQYMETPAKNFEEEFEFDIAHRQGRCSYPSLALCSAEEQRIKQFIRQLLAQERKKVIEEIDRIYKKEQGIHHWKDLREKLMKSLRD